jgi:hypothetical protein
MEFVALFLIALFILKHLIVDFFLQKEYQWKNKGTYGHPGGLLHAGLHGVSTMLVLSWLVTPQFFIVLGLFDAVAHYHIDWAKMRINAKMGWGPNTHEQFWWMVGLDQFLHMLTYILIVAVVVA